MKWQVTISGACKTFRGTEIIWTETNEKMDQNAARRKRDQLAREHGRMMYLSLVEGC